MSGEEGDGMTVVCGGWGRRPVPASFTQIWSFCVATKALPSLVLLPRWMAHNHSEPCFYCFSTSRCVAVGAPLAIV